MKRLPLVVPNTCSTSDGITMLAGEAKARFKKCLAVLAHPEVSLRLRTFPEVVEGTPSLKKPQKQVSGENAPAFPAGFYPYVRMPGDENQLMRTS